MSEGNDAASDGHLFAHSAKWIIYERTDFGLDLSLGVGKAAGVVPNFINIEKWSGKFN